MAVSEQTDSLRVLGSDPVDYLITPRTLACMIAGPILNLMCFVMGEPFIHDADAAQCIPMPNATPHAASAQSMRDCIIASDHISPQSLPQR